MGLFGNPIVGALTRFLLCVRYLQTHVANLGIIGTSELYRVPRFDYRWNYAAAPKAPRVVLNVR